MVGMSMLSRVLYRCWLQSVGAQVLCRMYMLTNSRAQNCCAALVAVWAMRGALAFVGSVRFVRARQTLCVWHVPLAFCFVSERVSERILWIPR